MSDKELNIKSSTIEKGLDLAKDFLGKLIFPAVEEVGLLMSDNIKVWRFKNQVRLLNNVEKYVKEKNISIKKVPLKILLPLLENASLEEEPLLNELWENLLINYVDSNKTFNSIVYPKILSELSSSEAKFILSFYNYIKYDLKSKDVTTYRNEYDALFTNKGLSKITYPEISNLIRLGILKDVVAYDSRGPAKFQYSTGAPESLRIISRISITELGKEFIEFCNVK